MNKRLLLYIIFAVVGLLVVVSGIYGYLYTSTPAHIRNPQFEHYHFRAQIIVEGKSVDFSADEFQQHYDKGSCSLDIAEHPIDFHDNAEQMVHVHWDGLTGGEFLKYFGWNFIGGGDESMGWRYDHHNMMRMHAINRYGDLLPPVPDNANFYVYAGDEGSYEQKDWNDFLHKNLEDFFGKRSNLKQGNDGAAINILDRLLPKAYAHGGADDGHGADEEETKNEEDLKRINNLIGNVVIFVQGNEPTDEQIKARFDNLAPLKNSTCGG